MSARRRIRNRIPKITGSGGGSPTVGNVVWGPDFGESSDGSTWSVGVRPSLSSLAISNEKSVGVTATMPALSAVYNAQSIGVAPTMPALELSNTKSIGVDISEASVVIDNMLSDEDTYLDRAAGTTPFGTATALLAKNNTAVVNDDKKTYIAWDLTGILGASVSASTIDLYMSENAAVGGVTATIQIYTHPTKPIEEDTATWNVNEPPPGTLRQTISQAVNSATPVLVTLTLDATTRANMLGNWVYVRVVGTSDGLGVNTITTQSKETVTSSQRPVMDMTITL